MATQKDRSTEHRRGKSGITKIKYRVAQKDRYCSIAERYHRVAAQRDKRELLHTEKGESDSTDIVERVKPQKTSTQSMRILTAQ